MLTEWLFVYKVPRVLLACSIPGFKPITFIKLLDSPKQLHGGAAMATIYRRGNGDSGEMICPRSQS